jgi:hypothetical protein
MQKKRSFLWILWGSFGMILSCFNAFAADEPAQYDAHGKRDPFVPLVTLTMREAPGLIGVETADELNVEGIVYDDKKGSVVVINGSVLREGEELGAVKVLKIKPNGVVVTINGVEAYKEMYQQEQGKETVS